MLDIAKWKRLVRLTLILFPLLGMMACQSNPPLTKPLPPPIVACGQGIEFETLPVYPVLHSRVAGESAGQYIIDLEADRTASVKWAVIVAGITERNAIRRNTTTQCLDNLRAKHVIF